MRILNHRFKILKLIGNAIRCANLNTLASCPLNSATFTNKLSSYAGYGVVVYADCTVQITGVQGSSFNGKPGTTSLAVTITGAGPATAVTSTSSTPLTSWIQNVTVGSGTATVTYNDFRHSVHAAEHDHAPGRSAHALPVGHAPAGRTVGRRRRPRTAPKIAAGVRTPAVTAGRRQTARGAAMRRTHIQKKVSVSSTNTLSHTYWCANSNHCLSYWPR